MPDEPATKLSPDEPSKPEGAKPKEFDLKAALLQPGCIPPEIVEEELQLQKDALTVWKRQSAPLRGRALKEIDELERQGVFDRSRFLDRGGGLDLAERFRIHALSDARKRSEGVFQKYDATPEGIRARHKAYGEAAKSYCETQEYLWVRVLTARRRRRGATAEDVERDNNVIWYYGKKLFNELLELELMSLRQEQAEALERPEAASATETPGPAKGKADGIVATIWEELAELHEQTARTVDEWIIRDPRVRTRFREMLTDFGKRWVEWDEATNAHTRRYKEHCRRVVDEPRLRDFKAGPPEEGWVFQDYLPDDHDLSVKAWGPNERQTVPPCPMLRSGRSANPRQEWETEPTEADLLPGYYAVLAVIRDNEMENTPPVLTPDHLKVPPIQVARHCKKLAAFEPYSDKDVIGRALSVVEADLPEYLNAKPDTPQDAGDGAGETGRTMPKKPNLDAAKLREIAVAFEHLEMLAAEVTANPAGRDYLRTVGPVANEAFRLAQESMALLYWCRDYLRCSPAGHEYLRWIEYLHTTTPNRIRTPLSAWASVPQHLPAIGDRTPFSKDLRRWADDPGLQRRSADSTEKAAGAEGTSTETESPNCTHSEDFTFVCWFGTRYDFTKTQAWAIRLLWEEWEKGGFGLGQEHICQKIASDATEFRLSKVFRVKGMDKHPAWGTMIVTAGKGIYKLSPENPGKSRFTPTS